MPKFFINQNQIIDNQIHIIGEDVKHIKNVLRNKVGDELTVCDGVSTDYVCRIKDILQEEILLEIMKKQESNAEPRIKVDLYQGYPKSDKMDLIVQKCTEIGINQIIPVIMKRTVVKLDGKDTTKKINRWQKIAEEASKQSKRAYIPNVKEAISYGKMLEKLDKYDIVIVPYECEKDVDIKSVLSHLNKESINSIAVLIGPEGGIDEKEVQMLDGLSNVKLVSLGKRILRTETAGMLTLSVIMYEFGELK